MQRFALTETTELVLDKGDITRVDTDAIVNAANPMLLGGGGVDGAIHRAAGPRLLAACRALPDSAGVRCPTGEARVTDAFDLPARVVVHTVGPVYRRHRQPAPLLAAAHRNSLRAAVDAGARRIAFPAISCGVYGYPLDEAAPIALRTCQAHCDGLTEVRFVLFDDRALQAWMRAATELIG